MKERIEEKVSTQNIETVCILIFSVEYIIRLACVGAVKPVREFLLDPPICSTSSPFCRGTL